MSRKKVTNSDSYVVMSMETKQALKELPKEEVKDIMSIFKTFDEAKTEKLTADALQKGLSEMGQKASLADIQKLMRKYDLNQDGYLDFAEFLAFVSSHKSTPTPEQFASCFDALDLDKNGILDRYEIIQWMKSLGYDITEKQADTMIAAADKNNDQKIDRDEFRTVIEAIFHDLLKSQSSKGRSKVKPTTSGSRSRFSPKTKTTKV